jgi:hypothetical protein
LREIIRIGTGLRAECIALRTEAENWELTLLNSEVGMRKWEKWNAEGGSNRLRTVDFGLGNDLNSEGGE